MLRKHETEVKGYNEQIKEITAKAENTQRYYENMYTSKETEELKEAKKKAETLQTELDRVKGLYSQCLADKYDRFC